MTRAASVLLLCLVSFGAPTPEAEAQVMTLRSWEEDVLVAFRDRQDGFGGYAFDRGLLRRYTPEMDHEYHIDLRAVRFSLEDDAAWYAADHGVRTTAASVDKARFATQTEVRHRLPLGGRHTVTFYGRQQDDLAARRFFVEGGYAYAVRPGHRIGFSQTMAGYKPDLDTELYYEARGTPAGDVRAGVFFLDAFNNVIFDALGVDPALQDTLRSYRKQPRLMRVRWLSPRLGPVRLEAFAGLHPTSEAVITTHSDPDFAYVRRDDAGYAVLHAFASHGPFTVGARARAWREQSDFSAPEGSSARRAYTSEQHESSLGLRTLLRLPVTPNAGLEAVADAALVRYRDRQTGSDFTGSTIPEAFDLNEDRLELELRLSWVPAETGFRGSVRWLSDHRAYNEGLAAYYRHYLRFAQATPNSRVSLLLGYDFQGGLRVEVGGSLDVDGDTFYGDRGPTRFDGGFGRVVLLW